MKTDIIYDICIIGLGAAGSHLLLAMLNDPFFDDKRVVVIEKETKLKHDRTWSFWEKNDGPYDHLCENIWSKGNYYSPSKHVSLDLKDYRYKTLHSDRFYDFVRDKLVSQNKILVLNESVKNVNKIENQMVIHTDQSTIKSQVVFDSRIPSEFSNKSTQDIHILQHFKGWLIKCKKPVFDSNHFTIMDYRINFNNQTCFTYVLPYDAHTAIIETTFFTEKRVDDNIYDELLTKYISNILNVDHYQIEHEEFGIIPMSTFPFHKYNTASHIRIGTGGGWVKASSGYMFRMAQDKAKQILSNYKHSRPLNQSIVKFKYRFYDRLLLDVLIKENHMGPAIFTASYGSNPIARLFKFLDEKSSLWEDFLFILSMPKIPFLRALWRQKGNLFK